MLAPEQDRRKAPFTAGWPRVFAARKLQELRQEIAASTERRLGRSA